MYMPRACAAKRKESGEIGVSVGTRLGAGMLVRVAKTVAVGLIVDVGAIVAVIMSGTGVVAVGVQEAIAIEIVIIVVSGLGIYLAFMSDYRTYGLTLHGSVILPNLRMLTLPLAGSLFHRLAVTRVNLPFLIPEQIFQSIFPHIERRERHFGKVVAKFFQEFFDVR